MGGCERSTEKREFKGAATERAEGGDRRIHSVVSTHTRHECGSPQSDGRNRDAAPVVRARAVFPQVGDDATQLLLPGRGRSSLSENGPAVQVAAVAVQVAEEPEREEPPLPLRPPSRSPLWPSRSPGSPSAKSRPCR